MTGSRPDPADRRRPRSGRTAVTARTGPPRPPGADGWPARDSPGPRVGTVPRSPVAAGSGRGRAVRGVAAGARRTVSRVRGFRFGRDAGRRMPMPADRRRGIAAGAGHGKTPFPPGTAKRALFAIRRLRRNRRFSDQPVQRSRRARSRGSAGRTVAPAGGNPRSRRGARRPPGGPCRHPSPDRRRKAGSGCNRPRREPEAPTEPGAGAPGRSHRNRRSTSSNTARSPCASPPAGRPGRSVWFQPMMSRCAQGVSASTNSWR